MDENDGGNGKSGWSARSFSALIEEDRPLLLACIRRRMGPSLRAIYDPEDILQEVYLTGWKALRGLRVRRRSALRAWLLCIARNRILDLSRGLRRRRHPRRTTPLPPSHLELGLDENLPAAGPGSREFLEEARRLRSCLDRLAFDQRTAVVLREYLSLPWPTVALVLHRSTSSARKVHARARRRLRQSVRPSASTSARSR